MPHIELNDLSEDLTITEEELKHVKGGLLPAYQLSANKISSHKLTSPTYFNSLDSFSLNYNKIG